jgi:hypothetical protein
VESSVLRSVGYVAGTLEVEFTSGRVYRYFGVARAVYDQLLRADSHGRFFNEHVRGHFRYARASSPRRHTLTRDPARL